MALSTLATFAAATSEMYKVQYGDKPILAHMLPYSALTSILGYKDPNSLRSNHTKFGRTYIVPLKVKRAHGTLSYSASDITLPNYRKGDWAEYEIIPKFVYSITERSLEEIERAMDDEQAFRSLTDDVFEDREHEIMRILIIGSNGDGSGVIGKASAVSVPNLTITLKSGLVTDTEDNYAPGEPGALWFDEGESVSWYNGATWVGYGNVTVVDRENHIITLDAFNTAPPVAGYTIIRGNSATQNDRNNMFFGVRKYLKNDTLFGLDRTLFGDLLAGHRKFCGATAPSDPDNLTAADDGQLTRSKIASAESQLSNSLIGVSGGKVKMITSKNVMFEISEEMADQVRYSEVKQDLNWSNVTIAGQEIMVDETLRPNTLLFIRVDGGERDQGGFKFLSGTEYGDEGPEGVANTYYKMDTVTGNARPDTVVRHWRDWGEMVCLNPRTSIASLEGIETSVQTTTPVI